MIDLDRGVSLVLHCTDLVLFRRSKMYFCCVMRIPLLDYAISIPRKYINGPSFNLKVFGQMIF